MISEVWLHELLQQFLIALEDMLSPAQMIALLKSGQWKLHIVWLAAVDMK